MTTSRIVSLVLATVGVVACSADVADPARPAAQTNERPQLRASMTGDRLVKARLPFVTQKGTRMLDVKVDETGHVWMGDMGFGSIDDLTPRAAGRSGLEWRWPNGVVNYVYQTNKDDPFRDINPGDPLRTTIRAAMDYIEARIPRVKFVEFPSVDAAPDEYVKIRKNGQNTGSSRSDVGLQGNLISEQVTDIGGMASNDIIIHELAHLLGLRHEQERPDRDQFIKVCDENTTESDPFATLSYGETDLLTPYEHNSIMHYRPNIFLVSSPSTGCGGLTMEAKGGMDTVNDVDEPGVQTGLGGSIDFTRHDINALILQYSSRAGKPEKGDMLGVSVATGDFDDDGYEDIAIGGPGEKPGDGDEDAGVIYVFKGTDHGPVPWMNLTAPGAGVHAMLGMSLVAGDFDGDGIADLAAGMPYKNIGGIVTGAVRVWHGGRFRGARFVTGCPSGSVCRATANAPLAKWLELSVADVRNETPGVDDWFGARLAAVDLNGDGNDELIVGAPGRANKSGRVFVFSGGTFDAGIAGGALSATSFPGGIINGALFGEALTVGDFDGDGFRDLAVGAPGTTKGNVYTFRGRSASFKPLSFLKIDPPSSASTGANFGVSLAAGKVIGSRDNIVAGASRQTNSGGLKVGAAYIYALDTPSSTSFSLKDQEISTKSEEEHFGSAVAVFDEDGDGRVDVAVGAPVHNTGRGRVVVFRSNGAQVMQRWELLPDGYAGGFGSSFAVGGVHHRNAWQRTVPLIVGAPYTDDAVTTNIGAIYGWTFNPSGAFESFKLWQNSHSKFANP